jgi:hypothetical protein
MNDCSKDPKMVSKLLHVENAEHEIYITQLLKKINNYNKHFLVIEENCSLKTNQFKILYIPYKESIPNKLSFNSNYNSLLTSIQLLIQNKIVHFDINKKNIIHSDSIYLLNFGISIDMTHVYSKFKKYFYTYFIKNYKWPLEVHLLCYQINVGKITPDILKTICTEFVNHHIILQNSNSKFVKEYTTKSIEYYSTIIQLPYDEFIKKCISSWKTWDNYALIIYLFEEKYTIPLLFLKNIHYLPTERLSVPKCIELTAASTA